MQIREHYPLYVASKAETPNRDQPVTDKYNGQAVTHVPRASAETVERAITAAADAAPAMARMTVYERQTVLHHCMARFEQRHEELAYLLCVEAGKPIRDARGEVTRLIETFRFAAEEAGRFGEQMVPLDASSRGGAYSGFVKRVPIGPCSFITPFNFPLNLVAHKVAPAIAAGCPFVLKPATDTPLGALVIGEILSESELPEGAFSILVASNENAAPLVEDERIKLLSFTGSDAVGWKLKSQAGKKKVHLELGGNAAVIVDRDADVGHAVQRNVFGGYYQSGQSCISVQRIYVQEQVYAEFRDQFISEVQQLQAGDPKAEGTFIGPLISEHAAEQVHEAIQAAIQGGATLLCGGKRDGAFIEPTVLENVPRTAAASREEIFAPVVMLSPFDDFDAAIERVNDSRFGLQAGVFTRDFYKIQRAWDQLEVGGVIVNDVPSWRVDQMPYGGVKDSGLGREGPRYAIEAMTVPRLLAVRAE